MKPNYLAAHALAVKASGGDSDARNELIVYFCRTLVPWMANQWKSRFDFDEATSIGNLAAVRAVTTALANYDPNRSKGLTEYVRIAIQSALSRAADFDQSAVQMPANVYGEVRRLKTKGRASLPAATVKRITPILGRLGLQDYSLSGVTADGESVLTIDLPDPAPGPEALATEHETRECIHPRLIELLGETDADIMHSLYFSDATADDVALLSGLTKYQVDYIRRRSLKILRSDPAIRSLLSPTVTR